MMKYLKVLVITGFLIGFAQVASPDTIYFEDGTVIKDCKVLETHEDSIKVKIIEQERPSSRILGAIERLWKEEWFSTDDILKIKYENGAVKYIHKKSVPKPSKAGLRTYAWESFGATVGGTLGLVGGSYAPLIIAGILIPEDLDPDIGPEGIVLFYGLMYSALIGGSIGGPVGSALGVTIAGKYQKQKGSFWDALGGSVAGAILPISLAFVSGGVTLIALPITMPLGAVIGYNYKALVEGDLPLGEILVGSTVGTLGCCVGYLIVGGLLSL
jgi:hypothetical protein